MTYPAHFFSHIPSHRIPEERWYALSGNPPPQEHQGLLLPFDEARIREAALAMCRAHNLTWHDAPARAQRLATHHATPHLRVRYSKEEHVVWLRVLLHTDPISSEEELTRLLDMCFEDSALHPPSRDQLRAMLATWMNTHNKILARASPLVQGVCAVLMQMYTVEETLALLLEHAPPQALVYGLKPLQTYTCDPAQHARIDHHITQYIARQPKNTHLLPLAELELIRLSPTPDRLMNFLRRNLDDYSDYNNRITQTQKDQAILSIQDPALFDAYVTANQPLHNTVFSPPFLIAHIHHFGLTQLERVVPRITELINSWTLMQWGLVFKIQHGALTDLMLSVIKREERYKDFIRLANAWIYAGGRLVIDRCIELAQHPGDLQEMAIDVLRTYAELGHAPLITTQLSQARRGTRTPHLTTISKLHTLCATAWTRHAPPPHTLPPDQLPGWLRTWRRRGLKKNIPIHLDVCTFPALYLRHAPELPLDGKTITGLLRYMQQFARKDLSALLRLRHLLTPESRKTLCRHLMTIWSVQTQHASQSWIAIPCAHALMDEEDIRQLAARYDASPHPLHATHGTSHDWVAELLILTGHPLAVHAIMDVYPPSIFYSSTFRHDVPPLIKQLAAQLHTDPVSLLIQYATRAGVAIAGKLYLSHAQHEVCVSYDEDFSPYLRARDRASSLTPEVEAQLVETLLSTTQERVLEIYQNVIPKTLEKGDFSWSYQIWRALMDHPLLRQIHRAILWDITMADHTAVRARCLEDLVIHDVEDVAIEPERLIGCTLRIAKIEALNETERHAWGILLAEDEQHLLIQEL